MIVARQLGNNAFPYGQNLNSIAGSNTCSAFSFSLRDGCYEKTDTD